MIHPDIEKIFKKPGEKRYDHFIKMVVKEEEVFGLADDEGWALLGDNDDADIIPLFQAPELAEAFRRAAGFDQFEVNVVDVNELMEWLSEMVTDNMLVAVCPNPLFNGAVVEPAKLKEDLQAEFDKEKGE